MYFSRLVFATALSLSGAHLSAHEFWIEPQNFQVENGEEMVIDLKNGQNFVGSRMSYFETQFTRFDLAQNGSLSPAQGRAGDRPALTQTATQDGLLVVVHETTANTLKYKEWEKFQAFATHKDFPNAEADHLAAGWPQMDFFESYTRHVKSLISVGSGIGADQNFGLATEFVALTNPYAKDFDGVMQVEVLFENAPRPNAQVEVFERAPDETVTVTLHRTNDNGVASIPVKPAHSYLFDAVVLRPHTADDKSVWQTLWAALTFAVPK
jgi:uncharacterized GH25 family protein